MKHCDDYIDDKTQPECLRVFLDYARSPAHGEFTNKPKPVLFATFADKTVRVNMASRFGDVGIAYNLKLEYGYDVRVPISDLSDFRTTT